MAIDYYYLPTYLHPGGQKSNRKRKGKRKIKKEKALSTAHDSLMKNITMIFSS